MKKPKDFKKTVFFLADTLKNYQYAFRGTTSLVLQGLDMNVQDIDIISDKKTALTCNKLLKDFLIEKVSFKESEKFKSFFGKFKINEILTEVYGEWQIKDTKGRWSDLYNGSNREKLTIDGKKVYVTKVETELSMFAKTGRWTAYHKILRQVKGKKEKENQQRLF